MTTETSSKLPVILGSRAAGTNVEESDYDIIIPTNHNKEDYVKKIDGKVDFFDRSYDLELLQYLNEKFDENFDKTILISDIKFIVPSKEIMSMIYLTSILRIIPYTENQETNIQIWLKRVNTYNIIRSQINYIQFDYELLSDGFIGKQFKERANDKFEKYGDTLISLDKTETEFFKDNIPRIFDHDWLHQKVAELCRNETGLLFPKLQKDGIAGLDKELFDKATTEFKISMLQEEIITLILERKIIPTIDISGDYDIEQYCIDINNIGSHFATNLCGQGFHFLRKYVLDHYQMIMNFNVEPNDIINIGLKLMNKEKKEEILEFPEMSKETQEIYKILRKHSPKNIIWNIKGVELNLETGRGVMEGGTEFYLDIKMIDKSGCTFKQYFLKKKTEPVNGFLIAEKENIKSESIKEYVVSVRKAGYYSSVSLCTGEREYKYVNKIKKKKVIKNEYSYYLNTYGTIKNVPHCEAITRLLLKENDIIIDYMYLDSRDSFSESEGGESEDSDYYNI
jgi:hypothetical protein